MLSVLSERGGLKKLKKKKKKIRLFILLAMRIFFLYDGMSEF